MPRHLAFCTWTTTEHGYKQTHLLLAEMDRDDLQDTLDGTIDNKAGYGSADGAQCVGEWCRAMIAEGHTHWFDTAYSSSGAACVRIRWQHMRGEDHEFCRPEIDVGSEFSQIERSVEALKDLGRRVETRSLRARKKKWEGASRNDVRSETFHDADEVIAALRARKDCVEMVRRDGYNQHSTVYVPKRKCVEYSLTTAEDLKVSA